MPHKPLAASDHFYTPQTRDDLYADVMVELDDSVGRVLDKLQELNLDEKTLVIFTSDNGPWFGGSTGGLRGMKGKTWEGGLRVPFIAHMPGVIPPGVVNSQPTASVDVLPTICRLAGVPIPEDRTIDGRDLMPLLKDASAPSRHKGVFGMRGAELATMRSGKWKLHVKNPGPATFGMFAGQSQAELENWDDPRGPDGVTILAPYEQPNPSQHPGVENGDAPQAMMLFDLEADPSEQHNIAEQHPEVVRRMMAHFNEVRAEVPKFPQPRSDYLFRGARQKGFGGLMRLIGGELRYDRVPPPATAPAP